MKNRPIARCLAAAFSIVTEALVALQVLSERRNLTAVVLVVAALTGATAAAAKDLTPADKGNGFSVAEELGLKKYEACWSEFKAKCGRNIVDDGLSSGEAPSDERVREWTATMESWLHPPEPTVASSIQTDVAPSTPATTSVPTTSAGGCPSYMAAEADSPSDVNPTSGASGCFQILPSTAAANGCSDVGPDCAARICASQGPSAWAASGANPCPYVQP